MKIKPVRDYDTWINFNFSWNDYRRDNEKKEKYVKDVYDFKIRFAGNPLIVIEQLYLNAWGTEFMKNYNLSKTKPELVSTENKEKLWYAIKVTKEFLKALSDAKEEPLVIYMHKHRDTEQAG
jgi:hypothetical protein